MEDLKYILAENKRREKRFEAPYNPLTGVGCWGARFSTIRNGEKLHLPIVLKTKIKTLTDDELNFARTVCDFEFWAARCARVQDKRTGNFVPLVLNNAQRIIYAECAEMLAKHQPIRIIVLKARQVGSSTFACAFALWLMLCRNFSWNTGICGHNKDVALNFIETMQNILDFYPEDMKTKLFPAIKQLKNSQNQYQLKERNCKIIATSSLTPDSLRSNNLKIALMTEVAFWSGTASDIVRSICGSIEPVEETFIVYESTPNGCGGFFYQEYKRAIESASDKKAVFVPWWKMPLYRMNIKDPASFFMTLNSYEKWLWGIGCSLQQIAWYRNKRKEYQKSQQMFAEFPSSYNEAFRYSGHTAFAIESIEKAAENVKQPSLKEFGNFTLSIYREQCNNCFLVCNIGGVDVDSQMFSINVFGEHSQDENKMEVCAEWAGLCDYDLMVKFIEKVCKFYATKFVVFCSFKGNEGDGQAGLQHCYNLAEEAKLIVPKYSKQWKTHQHTRTSALIALNEALRCGVVVEHSENAIAQYRAFMKDLNGYSTIADDKGEYLITNRAIGLMLYKRLITHQKKLKNLFCEKHYLISSSSI